MLQQTQALTQNLHKEFLQGRLRQASAARPQRREREQMKCIGVRDSERKQTCGSLEMRRCVTECGSLHGQSEGEDSLLLFPGHDDHELVAKRFKSMEASLQQSVTARLETERELEQQKELMAAESLKMWNETQSLKEELAKARLSAIAAQEISHSQLTKFIESLMKTQEVSTTSQNEGNSATDGSAFVGVARSSGSNICPQDLELLSCHSPEDSEATSSDLDIGTAEEHVGTQTGPRRKTRRGRGKKKDNVVNEFAKDLCSIPDTHNSFD